MSDVGHGHVRQEIIQVLGRSSRLRYLGQHHPDMQGLRRMLEKAEVLHFESGRTIMHKGQEPDRMFFLMGGMVDILKGGKRIAMLVRLGDVFGEFDVMTGELRCATMAHAPAPRPGVRARQPLGHGQYGRV
ncbi:MAG: cyclic nucleotide-binding domain-containing protein [Candidatus Hydrogenedentota bacterium]